MKELAKIAKKMDEFSGAIVQLQDAFSTLQYEVEGLKANQSDTSIRVGEFVAVSYDAQNGNWRVRAYLSKLDKPQEWLGSYDNKDLAVYVANNVEKLLKKLAVLED